MNIVLLATAWGPRHGGLNAFNQDFAIGLVAAMQGNGRVFCAVPNPTDDETAAAENRGVTLVPLKYKGTTDRFDPSWIYETRDWLKRSQRIVAVDWWVGHDLISGGAAVAGSETGEGGVALVMHMSCIDYRGVMSAGAADADARHRLQRILFSNPGARVFAVGPLLRDAGAELTGRVPVMLVPGFPVLPKIPPAKKVLVAITFGRMDRATDQLKQGRLAMAGFGKAIGDAAARPDPLPALVNPRIYLIGLAADAPEEAREAVALAENHARRVVNVLALPYDEQRETLFERLAGANLALMLSWHEGFGLTGWEAIAAELPLIVTRRSGVYQLIEESLGGPGTGCLHGVTIEGQRGQAGAPNYTATDLDTVCNLILNVAGTLEHQRRNAAALKRLLIEKFGCTWEATARQFLQGLGAGTPADVASPGFQASPAPVDPAVVEPTLCARCGRKLKNHFDHGGQCLTPTCEANICYRCWNEARLRYCRICVPSTPQGIGRVPQPPP